jgi:hypothetical protein
MLRRLLAFLTFWLVAASAVGARAGVTGSVMA